MACVADREAGVREVAQVYELIKLQPPLLLRHSPPPPWTTQLAQSLLSKALRALNVAPLRHAPRRGAKTRRSSVALEGKKTSSSWTNSTAVPYDDGYQWRKYGETKINGTRFTRSYFRCTYAGCLATKHVGN